MSAYRKRLLTGVAIAIPVGLASGALLRPIIGMWRTAAIVFLATVLASMYVNHRWPLRQEHQP